jgi:hypothetical protein
LRPYYVFYGKLNEFPWTVVVLTPMRKRGDLKKFYVIGGVQQQPDDTFLFKVGRLPYRVDRKNRYKLGEKVRFSDLPEPIQAFVTKLCTP